MGKIEPLGT